MQGFKVLSISWRTVCQAFIIVAFVTAFFPFALWAQGKQQDPRQLFEKAHEAQQNGQTELAVSEYRQILQGHPKLVAARANLAAALVSLGRFDEAIEQYREAIRMNHLLPGVHYELAEQLRMSPDPALNAQAEDEYRAAVGLNPYDEMSWRQLGSIMAAKGDLKTAEEDYRKALALQPQDSEAKTGLAIVMISKNQTQDAISLLESAVKDDPTNTVAHYRLSGLYRRAGRTEDAEREMKTFRHYTDVKNKLSKVFKQLAGPTSPM